MQFQEDILKAADIVHNRGITHLFVKYVSYRSVWHLNEALYIST